MLPRVLEPEAMDSPGEAHDYDAMDHAQVNRAFVDDLLAFAPAVADGPSPLLDLGTGTAQIPIELCQRAPQARVLAVDLAASMLDLAGANLVLAGLRGRIALEQVDAKGLPYAAGSFAATISNSIVHHVPQPRAMLAEAVRVTAPGGILFIRDLLRPDTDEQVAQLVARYAATATPRQRALFQASLHAALNLAEIRTMVGELGCPPDSVQQTSDRHWTFAARRPPA